MAKGPVESRLLDLLIQWKKSVRNGRELSAEDLCVHCPELIDELRLMIEAVRAMVPVAAIDALPAEFRPSGTGCADHADDRGRPL